MIDSEQADTGLARRRIPFISLVGLLLTISAISIDMMLPALPSIARQFGVSEAAAQAVVTVFLLGFGLPHLVIGAAGDKWGRRRVVMAGLGIYLLGTLACLLAPSFGLLLGGRFVQGLGAAAGPILARAMLRDVFSGKDLARYLSLAMVFFAAGPVLAPGLGALVLGAGGWPAIFGVLAGVAFLLVLCVWRLLPETLRVPQPDALHASRLVAGIREVLLHSQSGPIIVLNAVIYGGLIAYLSTAPTIFISDLGLSAGQFALLFSLTASATLASQFVNVWLLRRFDSRQILLGALWLLLPISACLAWQTASGAMTPASLAVNVSGFLLCFTLVMANGTALVVDPHRRIAGIASSLLGFTQLLVGTGLGWLIGTFIPYGPVALGVGDLAIAVLLLAYAYSSPLAARTRGESPGTT